MSIESAIIFQYTSKEWFDDNLRSESEVKACQGIGWGFFLFYFDEQQYKRIKNVRKVSHKISIEASHNFGILKTYYDSMING